MSFTGKRRQDRKLVMIKIADPCVTSERTVMRSAVLSAELDDITFNGLRTSGELQGCAGATSSRYAALEMMRMPERRTSRPTRRR
jgi:hypothetical protein